MEIKRQIDTTTAKFCLNDLNNLQFNFLRSAINHYAIYTHHCIPDKDTPIGELVEKIELMNNSSLTIIK